MSVPCGEASKQLNKEAGHRKCCLQMKKIIYKFTLVYTHSLLKLSMLCRYNKILAPQMSMLQDERISFSS